MKEYAEEKDYVENQKPYWLFLDAERGQEMEWGLFNYFPEVHYKKAVDQALEEEVEEELVPDGGYQPEEDDTIDEERWTDEYDPDTVYFWHDSSSNTVIQEEILPGLWVSLFDYEEEALDFMGEYAEDYSLDQINHYELYEAELDSVGTIDDML